MGLRLRLWSISLLLIAHQIISCSSEIHVYAAYESDDRVPIFGSSATTSVWKPFTIGDDMSLAQISIINTMGIMETIEVGWQVQPNVYGNNEAHLFTFYTPDDYETMCYNLQCPGFVLDETSPFQPGRPIADVSDGETLHRSLMSLRVVQNATTGNWDLHVGVHRVGHFVGTVFNNLRNGATGLQVGGGVAYGSDRYTKTGMGSGVYNMQLDPATLGSKVAFFSDICYYDIGRNPLPPQQWSPIATAERCYTLGPMLTDQLPGPTYGRPFFYYGGTCPGDLIGHDPITGN